MVILIVDFPDGLVVGMIYTSWYGHPLIADSTKLVALMILIIVHFGYAALSSLRCSYISQRATKSSMLQRRSVTPAAIAGDMRSVR